ncbi:MAG: hypothetical protein DK306_002367 [Chloroflexi bacterium]|nr:MAG: hypothetical protein DK306_002367 [Chloroflexota bacterium]
MEDVRDYVLIVALIMYGVTAFVLMLALTFACWKLLKGLRWVRRQHDDRLAPLVLSTSERIVAMNTQMSDGSGATEVAMAGFRFLQSKRKRRRKTRLQRARATIAHLRPG